FEWICAHAAWFDIFYEHVNYFRAQDFERMFGAVHEIGHLFGGQYLYVVADLATLRAPHYDASAAVRFPATFASRGAGERGTQGPQSAVIWGGAAKGVIFALQCERDGTPVEAVIDITPAKQGKYLPATGLRVHSPAEVLPRLEAGATIYVMNSNYLEE